MNVAYLMATAEEAGYPVELIAMSQIGWDVAGDRVLFVPAPGQEHKAEPIDIIFMLYPWEWFWNEEGGKAFFRNMADPTQARHGVDRAAVQGRAARQQGDPAGAVEAVRRRPGARQVPAAVVLRRVVGGGDADVSYAKKPIWGREGGSVTLVRDGVALTDNPSEYGADGRFVVQELLRAAVVRRPGGHGAPGDRLLADRRRAGRHGHPRGPRRRTAWSPRTAATSSRTSSAHPTSRLRPRGWAGGATATTGR